MKKEVVYLIGFILLVVIAVAFLFFYKKPISPVPQPTLTFPSITTTSIPAITTTSIPVATPGGPTEITLPKPLGTTNLGKIKKFEAKKYQSGDFISEYLLVNKEGLEPGTKIYMPYDGYILYYSLDEKNINFQISTNDNNKVVTLIGLIKPLCKVTRKTSGTNYCENVKQGTLIGEVSEAIKETSRDFALQIFGIVNYKDDIEFLYQTLPLIFK